MVFSSTLTVIRCISFWYKPIGYTLLCNLLFFFSLKVYTVLCSDLQFRFRVRLMLRVMFRGYV